MSAEKAVIDAEVVITDADKSDTTKLDKSYGIIKKNVLWSMGAGLLPTPLLDLTGITAVQVKMINELCDLYSMKFKESLVRSSIMSLLAGMGSTAVGLRIGASAVKIIPVIGAAIGSVAVPSFAGATTYAVGRVFVMHFEAGGTLANFDAKKTKSYFAKVYEEGKQTVKDLKKKTQAVCAN